MTKGENKMYSELDEVINASPEAPRYNISYPTELYSEILPGLWIGGTDDDDVDIQKTVPAIQKKDFDTVVTAYAWANPCDWFVKEIRFGFYDGTMEDFNPAELEDIVSIAHADWKKGKRVLTRCQAGLNRSSLFCALIMMKEGYTADEAISLIREKRSGYALFNKKFVEYLKSI
jgi:hypothetical protein